MPPVVRLTSLTNDATVLTGGTLSTIVASEGLEFPAPELKRVEAETFQRPGVYVGATKHGLRRINLPLVIDEGSASASLSRWRQIARAVDAGCNLEVDLVGSGNSVWFDLLRSPIQPNYKWTHFGPGVLEAVLELDAQPYARGPSISLTLSTSNPANAPEGSQYFTITGTDVLGDVEAPATVEITFATTPNRLVARLARRTFGTVANFLTLYEGESATGDGSSTADAAASGGNMRRITFTAAEQERTCSWTESTNPGDRVGLFQVYAKLIDRAALAGNLLARASLTLGSGGQTQQGEQTVVDVDADHLSSAYELVFLGTFRVPSSPVPTQWTWTFGTERISGTESVDLDYLLLIPVEESYGAIDFTASSDVSASSNRTFTMQTSTGRAWWGTASSVLAPCGLRGRGLYLPPGTDSRILVQASSDTGFVGSVANNPPSITVDPITAVTVSIVPQYLWVR